MYTGDLIRRLRMLKGFNQKGIAIKLGITQQAYSKLEKSKSIDKERLRNILNAMNCNEDELELIQRWTQEKK